MGNGFGRPEGHTTETCMATLSYVDDALYAVGGKWKLRIIIALSDKAQRFNELQRKIKGISARVLSNELKDLELNGFITRTIQTRTPVVIEYGLTDYSHTLHKVIAALSEWGALHRRTIQKKTVSDIAE